MLHRCLDLRPVSTTLVSTHQARAGRRFLCINTWDPKSPPWKGHFEERSWPKEHKNKCFTLLGSLPRST